MALFKAENSTRHVTPGKYRFLTTGYRTYPNQDRLYFADEARVRFRQLLFDLKAGDAFALELFSSLLCLIYDDVLGGPDAIACVPTSAKSKAVRDDAIALLAQKAISAGLGVIDGSSWLRRTQDVPKAHQDGSMRTFAKQFETIECVPPEALPEVRRIVVIDDICTSGTTIEACVTRLREQFPRTDVIGFTFGFTAFVSSSPLVPDFPKRNQPLATVPQIVEAWRDEAWPLAADGEQSPFFSADKTVHIAGRRCVRPPAGSDPVWSQMEAEKKALTPCRRCGPFDEKPRFVLNWYSLKIHHVDCHTKPTGHGFEPLWSLRQGIRLNGKPCKNCMHRWPVADALYQERRKKLAAERALAESQAKAKQDLEEVLNRPVAPLSFGDLLRAIARR